MQRVISYILVFAALIVQVGMGALPPGEACICIPVASDTPSCCCDDEGDSAATVERSCPCHNGCEHCICLPTHDGRATLTAQPQTNCGHDWVVAAMDFGVPTPVPAYAPPAIGAAPRATESPPHLRRLRTTQLVI